ncbi:MAG: tRNA guanosine(34) transglycosylase Tgt [Planctomycetes bacterium]|nr:tRNA guanosine(34) transglycosylase Tgt [Planctomycetota bacterium]
MNNIHAGQRGPFASEILAQCPKTAARRTRLRTPHGTAETPAFMPVGTAATVKGADPEALLATGSEFVLCNTYHLALRPGAELIAELGGLHRFMGWNGPVLTDSGGFQVFSLAQLRKVDDDGVSFRSHIDGAVMRLTPERATEIQLLLGADVIMAFDECLPHDADAASVRASVQRRTLPWAKRCLALHPQDGRALFGIGQGGMHEDLRREHMTALREMPFDGFAVGGLSVGESNSDFRRILAVTAPLMPPEKPRYLMGVGSVPEILDAIALGIDMFDCVLPSRNARNGQALTFAGPVRMRNAAHTRSAQPLEADCDCSACSRGFSRAYLRHLLMANEILGAMLMTLHNLRFMQRLMERARDSIVRGDFTEFATATKIAFGSGLVNKDAPNAD